MANEPNVGYASFQVIPVVPGVQAQLSRSIIGPLASAGREGGQQAGKGIASGLQSAEAAVSKASASIAKARDREADAAGRVRIAEAQLEELRDKGVTSGARLTRATEALESAQRKQAAEARTASAAAADLAQAQKQVAAANDDVEDSSERGGSALDGLGAKALAATGNLKALALGGAGIGAALGAGIAANMGTEAITDKLAASLGAGGNLAAEYGKAAGDVYRAGFGGSLEEASAAVGVVQSSFRTLGFEGEASLAKVTERAINFSSVFGTDVEESVQTVSTLMSVGLVKDTTEGFDLMTTAFQRVPAAMRQELPEILHEYGVNFAALGFTGEQAFAAVVTAADKGKFALDKTGDALKEFTIRGSDMSKTSVEAYQLIGLNAEDMSRKIATGGPAAQEALQTTARGLLGIEDPAQRANTAIALFGTPLEDLSIDQIPALLESLTGVDPAMSGFAGATDRMGETLNDNGIARIEAFKRSLTGGLTDALGNTANWIADNVPLLKDLGIAAGIAAAGFGALALQQGIMAAGGAAAFFTKMIGLTKAWAAQQFILNTLMSLNPIGIVVLAVVALVAAIVLAYRNSETFRNIVQGLWRGIQTGAAAMWSFLQPVFDGFMTGLRAVGDAGLWLWHNALEPAFNAIGFVISVFWAAAQITWELMKIGLRAVGEVGLWLWHNAIEPAMDGIGKAISFMWDNVVSPVFGFFKAGFDTIGAAANWLWNEVIVPAFNGIKNAISTVWDFLKPVLDNIGRGISALGDIGAKVGDAMRNAFDGVVDLIKAPIHALGGLLAKVPDSILGVEIPGASAIKGWGVALQNLRGGGTIGAGRDADGRLWGPGTGTSDSIIGVDARGAAVVRVSNKEGVVTAEAMDNGGAGLVALLNRAGGLPGYAKGGQLDVYGLPPGSSVRGAGGFPPWVGQLSAQHGVQPSTYPGHQEDDRAEAGYAPNPGRLNRGIDWTGSVAEMDAFARYLLGIAPGTPALEQVIWQNPNTGAKAGWAGRSPDTGFSYFAGDYGGHTDHVHTRQSASLLGASAPPKPDTVTAVPGYESPDLVDTPGGSVSPGSTTAPPSGATSGSKQTRLKTFKELGSDLGGILAEGIGETLGLPEWVMDPNYFADKADTGDNVRTSVTTDSGASAAQAAKDSLGTETPATTADIPAATVPVDPAAGLSGHDLYAYWIARAALDAGVGRHGAVIGEGTALVEAGDPLKMWANRKVPASLNFAHDAVGSDGTSTGLFQQQDNGAWGSIEDRMDPYRSAGMFYGALKKVGGWESMDPGAAAQAVQRSAYPAKYGKVMARAAELVDNAKVFDTGGVWDPGTMGFNGLSEPELVIKKSQWGVLDRQTQAVEKIAASGSGGGDKLADTVVLQGYTMEELGREWSRRQWARTAGRGTSRNR